MAMERAACMATAPLRWRAKPYPSRKKVFFVVPTSRAKSSISSTERPVISEAHCGVFVFRCASSPAGSSAKRAM
ncbi:hypothetical protein D3C86_1304860 [compost metagenome]